MTDKKERTHQLGIKIKGEAIDALARMAAESGQTVTTVAKALLLAAIKQAEGGRTRPLPPYLRRFYGDADDLQEEDE